MPADDKIAARPEPVTLGDLLLASSIDANRPVMLRVRGEVFTCTAAYISFEGPLESGHYVLMLDGETRD
jgi:hypothetical protein